MASSKLLSFAFGSTTPHTPLFVEKGKVLTLNKDRTVVADSLCSRLVSLPCYA